MKKYFLFFTLLFCLLGVFAQTFGASSDCPAECKIKDGTPSFLLEYFNTINKISGNVKSEISSASKNTSVSSRNTTNGRMQKDLLRIFNLFGDWTGYYSSFEFYVKLPLTQSVPYPVKRDQELITQQVDRITKLLESVTQKGQQDIIITKPCAGVEEVCTMDAGSAGSVLGAILMNTKKIGELYRLSILGQETDFNDEILFVKPDFKKQMAEYYNSFTPEDCSRCKGESTDIFETRMSQITNMNKWSNNGTQKWIDAWNMLIGNVDEVKQRAYERQILAKELSHQGLSQSSSAIILKNLDKYNNQGFYSIDNNFIANTFENTVRNIGTQLNSFNETILQKFNSQGKNRASISSLLSTQQDVKNTQDTKSMIDVVYQTELPFAASDDTSSELLQGKLIDYHKDLIEVIAELNKIIPISQNICKSQAYGLGLCTYGSL